MGKAKPADARTAEIFTEVARVLWRRPPEIHVEFYPYTTIKSVARRGKDGIRVRITDTLSDAPSEVKRALGFILLARHARKTCPEGWNRVYDEYVYSDEMRAREKGIRRSRGKLAEYAPKGSHYDLAERFELLNILYFGGQMERPNLAWTGKPNRRVFGTQDDSRDLITINRALDSPDVPRLVVDYVIYHEMLHVKHAAKFSGGKRWVHTREFREDERKFKGWKDAEAWIQRISRRRKWTRE